MLDEIAFSNEVTFTKGAGGISTADGQFVSDVAATRGLGRISGGRMYGYQVGTPPLISCLCSDACCTAQAPKRIAVLCMLCNPRQNFAGASDS